MAATKKTTKRSTASKKSTGAKRPAAKKPAAKKPAASVGPRRRSCRQVSRSFPGGA